MSTQMKPQEQVAAQFMAHKGYADLRPVAVEKEEGEPCWYFDYLLPEGRLELEVAWTGSEWECLVGTFNTFAGSGERRAR
jgi:hypothetical protein